MKRKMIGVVCALAITVIGSTVFGMTLYGTYGFHNGVYVGQRAWAYEGSGYNGAAVKITEGSYDSGWSRGRDVSVQKVNNPFQTCYGHHYYY